MTDTDLEKETFRGYLGAEIVKLNSKGMDIMLHSGFSSLIVLFRLITNSMKKLNIDFVDIKSIKKGDGFLNDRGYFIIGIDNQGNEFKKLTLLHLLNNKDKKILFKILDSKNIKLI